MVDVDVAATAAATAAIPEVEDVGLLLFRGCFSVGTGCGRRSDFAVVESEVGILPPRHPIAIDAELFFVDVYKADVC